MDAKEGKMHEQQLNKFWRHGDEIICTRIFRRSDNECYLCGNTPIEWHHVLLNTISNQIIDVELSCVIEMKKILEKLGSDRKILFFPQYEEEVNHINSLYQGTAAIVEFNPNPDIIINLLSKPKNLTYKQVRPILDHTCKFNDEFMSELFHAALDIYLERKYYIYDSLEEHEKTDNVEQCIKNHLREEWERIKSEVKYKSSSYIAKADDKDIPF
jgi:hypothetical protein